MTTASEPINLSGVRFYTAWHLNLNYSSIEKVDRPKVIEKCYWPLLNLAESTGCPQGIEISGSSLRMIEQLDPSWLKKLAALETAGLVEVIASGYEQIVGPLAPAKVNLANLTYGNEVIQELLGVSPSVSFVSEQCASSGVLAVHQDAGFGATVMEWENAWIANPSWPANLGWSPQRFKTSSGIGIIWNHSRLFQGLQKFAHDELDLYSLTQMYEAAQGVPDAAFCFYGGDAETFDFRGGRFSTEALQRTGEWMSLENVVRLTIDAGARWVRPSNLIQELPSAGINPFTFENQILTKKQAKYNAVRWAVCGRNNYELNSYAHRLSSSLSPPPGNHEQTDLAAALPIWASDLRTHLTDLRWAELKSQHPGASSFSSSAERGGADGKPIGKSSHATGRVALESNFIRLLIDPSKGCTIDSAMIKCPCRVSLFGRLPYGSLGGPLHSPDWYSGNVVYQTPTEPQDSDIAVRVFDFEIAADGLALGTRFSTRSFDLTKTFRLVADESAFDTTFEFKLKADRVGTLRAGFMTLMPHAWDWESAVFGSHDGGFQANLWRLAKVSFDMGLPVSPNVSATNVAGISEGNFWIADSQHKVEVELDQYSRGAALMLAVNRVSTNSLFRSFFSIQEHDDTFRPARGNVLRLSYRTRLECLAFPRPDKPPPR
jgi:hypothetical protein